MTRPLPLRQMLKWGYLQHTIPVCHPVNRSPVLTCCGGTCIDMDTDEQNCGTCGNKCGKGETCCHGKCSKVDSDEKHCGICGNECAKDCLCCHGNCTAPNSNDDCGSCGNKCHGKAGCLFTSLYSCHACFFFFSRLGCLRPIFLPRKNYFSCFLLCSG